jgi:Undecaprenyl-phosphate glucose phosphotransferase
MVKQHSQFLLLFVGLGDLLTISAAWFLSYYLRFTYFPSPDGVPGYRLIVSTLLIALPISIVVFLGLGLYKPRRDKSFLVEMGQLIKATVILWVLLIIAIYFTSSTPFTRGMLAMFLPLLMIGLILERGTCRSTLRYLRRRGWNLRHAVIIGTGRLAQSTCLRLQRNSWTGIRVAGFISTPPPTVPHTKPSAQLALPPEIDVPQKADVPAPAPPTTIRNLPVLGSTDHLLQVVNDTHADCVFIALPSKHADILRRVIAELEKTSVDVRIIPDLFLSRFPTNVAVSELDGLPIVTLREDPLAGWPAIYKRLFDVFGALLALFMFALPMLAIAAVIKLQDGMGAPVFYRQRRISYGRRAFNMLKFRSMKLNAEVAGPAFAAKDDPRCTRFGRWLRSTSLDELPQLFNVLWGDMSLVGPRPERPEMLEKIQQEVPGFPLRLKVRAGLTGWAQVNGFRGRTSFKKRLQYDLYYLNNWSPLLDFRIVLATIYRGFKHPNAY